MSAAVAMSSMASLRPASGARANGKPAKSAVRTAALGRRPRGSTNLSSTRRASQRTRAGAVVVVDVEEDDEVSPTDSIDDDDLPFDLDEYKAVVKLLVTFQEPDWVNPWSNKTF